MEKEFEKLKKMKYSRLMFTELILHVYGVDVCRLEMLDKAGIYAQRVFLQKCDPLL